MAGLTEGDRLLCWGVGRLIRSVHSHRVVHFTVRQENRVSMTESTLYRRTAVNTLHTSTTCMVVREFRTSSRVTTFRNLYTGSFYLRISIAFLSSTARAVGTETVETAETLLGMS